MRPCVFTLVLLLAGTCAAQMAVEQQVQMQAGRPDGAADKSKPKPSPEQLERGRRMLQSAEAAAGGLEGGMRAYALLQIARAYQGTDKKKAIELLDQALAATRGMDSDDRMNTRERLQEQVLQALVPLAPQRADELLNQVEPESRGKVLIALLGYYQKNKDWDRALAVVYRIAPEAEVPYEAVGRILDALPPERAMDAQQLFATALRSFTDHPPTRGVRFGTGDFANLLLKNWKKLPKDTVLTGIHEVLKQAQAQGKDSGPSSVSMASPSGAVAFNSMYEFRLFQLLPALRQLDEAEANKLLKQYQDVQTLIGKYPEAMDSISPPQPGDRSNSSTSFSIGGPGPSRAGAPGAPGGQPAGMPSPLAMQQSAKIVADSEKHPQDALASALALPDRNLRAQTLLGIAQNNARKNTSATKEALDKCLDLVADVPVQEQVMMVGNVARLYMEIDETASARKTIEKGMGVAEKAYKQDTNADDPNKALKAYWPSAEAYRSMLRLAARISPPWAMTLTNEISDPEMKAMAQIALAEAWLDLPSGQRMVMSSTKAGNMMMSSREDR